MAKATWNGATLAESDVYEVVEGNVYFPRSALVTAAPGEGAPGVVFEESTKKTVCGWKGEASYFHVTVNGAKNEDCAWTYPTPKDAAKNIAGHVAFWRGVEVTR